MEPLAVVDRLVRLFADHPSLPSAQRHYKLEEWAAVEAFAFFDRQMPGWHAAGTLPYFSTNHKGEEKWIDVYARLVEDGVTRTHLWIEFKAIPFGASRSSKTLGSFVSDVRCLAAMEKTQTVEMWNTQINPKTGTNHGGWFGKCRFPGSISEGDFFGIAMLFVALGQGETIRGIHDAVTKRIGGAYTYTLAAEVPSLCGDDGIGCLAYLIPIRGSGAGQAPPLSVV